MLNCAAAGLAEQRREDACSSRMTRFQLRSPRRHLCREDASIRVSHVPAQVVQDAPRHACVRSIAGQAEGVQVCLGELAIVIQHLRAQGARRRVQQSGEKIAQPHFLSSIQVASCTLSEHQEVQHQPGMVIG